MAEVKVCRNCSTVNKKEAIFCICGEASFIDCVENEKEGFVTYKGKDFEIKKFKICPDCLKENDWNQLVCSNNECRKELDKALIRKKVEIDLDISDEHKREPDVIDGKAESESEDKKALIIYKGGTFQGFEVLERMKVLGGQSDLYKVKKDSTDFVLKAYRHGIKVNERAFEKIGKLCQTEEGSRYLVKIVEFGFHTFYEQYFEIHEYAPLTLHDWINKKGKIDEETAGIILQQLVWALKFIHSNDTHPFFHRDIKPSNILIRSEKDPIDVVLSDFGNATLIIGKSVLGQLTDQKGTTMYQSPEAIAALEGKVYVGKETDYWSMGMVLLEMITGTNPYSEFAMHVVAKEIVTSPVPIDKSISEYWEKIIKGLLTKKVELRWGYEQVTDYLRGKEDIPVYFEEEETIKKKSVYQFEGKDIDTIDNLAKEIIKNPDNWEEGKRRLFRGSISKWIEDDLKEQDMASKIDDIRENNTLSEDLVLFDTIYTLNPKLPFVSRGIILGSIFPEWNFQPLCKYLEEYYELKGGSSKDITTLVEQLFQNNLFSRYLVFVGAKKEQIEKIQVLEERVNKLGNLSLKTITFLLAINGQEEEFKRIIEERISQKVFPSTQNFKTASNIINNEIMPDGETVVKIKNCIIDAKNSYNPELLKKQFEANTFRGYLREIFKNKEKFSNKEEDIRFTEDLFKHQIYSQYLKFIKSSEENIRKIEYIERTIDSFKPLHEKALIFYILHFNAREEIKQEILQKYSKKIIIDYKKDSLLNQARNEFRGNEG